jgi:predicted CoA-binding protein
MECEFPQSNATTAEIAQILKTAKTIAVVGLSPKPDRPSHGVSAYMQAQGYKIIPVNPSHAEILGEKAYKSLLDIPEPIDIVDIFRDPSAVPEIVDQAIQKKAKAIWMQEGIVHNAAAEKARAAGLKVVMNKCIYKEHHKVRGKW